ncbi:Type 4 prepilin-like proteins leader peptide-processing enzyme [Paenibacillus plantiphilus]|uniref:Type 4 prepilin-like proteins leader peptide-processing enzyme n=1 Tax=Paenibacillus plantiphilus TaxID=2905650 RepID=A0ABM9C426_9BACL|nr:A24 family peptidase [Paenibacillus plantiphilus]CAH1202522.1 Type 4 prepilin-like proteins leader peptide-processing enzyme [Paenibacillus plantiphilus]
MFILEVGFIAVVGLAGLIIGSFLNVVAIRLLEGTSIAFPASHCMTCKIELKSYELIPVLSYLFLRGKCRICKTSISPVYPIGEASAALLFILFAWKLGWQLELLPGLIFVSVMIVIVHTDLKARIIPDRVILFGLLVIVPIRLFITYPLPLWDYAVASLLVGCLLYALAVISKGGFGGGDIKLFALIGLFIGLKATLLALFAASLIGYLFGMLGRLRRRGTGDKSIPFGPYIAVAGVFAYLWGNQLFDWYWSLYG